MMETEIMETEKRKRGAPLGNQNARKHGFYSRFLDPDEERDLAEAREMEGLSEEICLLRAKILSILRHDPDNINLIMSAVNTLAKLVRTHYDIGAADQKGISDGIVRVLKNVALPMGIKLVGKLK